MVIQFTPRHSSARYADASGRCSPSPETNTGTLLAFPVWRIQRPGTETLGQFLVRYSAWLRRLELTNPF